MMRSARSPVVRTSSTVATARLTGTSSKAARKRAAERAAQLAAAAVLVQRPRERAAEIAAHARRVTVVLEPGAEPRRQVGAAQPALDGLANEKMIADEARQRAADLVLARRYDRGVRDRQAQRPAKQRRHREPVCEPADERGFGESAHCLDVGVRADEPGGDDVHDGHRDQQRGGDCAHSPQTACEPGIRCWRYGCAVVHPNTPAISS